MFYRLKNRLQRGIFDRRVHTLLRTPPAAINQQGLTVLTQLQHKDVLMYLAAVKSFAGWVPVAQVYVLNDGSLDANDKAILAEHVPGIKMLELRAFQEEGLPKGGTWERLIAIARFSAECYMVQLDADTLSLGKLPEVVEAWRMDRNFSIGTWDGQTTESALERARDAKKYILKNNNPHVQLMAEAHFDQLSGAESLHYVRGCSGFAGFSRAPERLSFMREISGQMERLIQAKWLEWGSEQVMSNLLVAHQPEAFALPHPDYADCQKMRLSQTRFIHFIGPCRFLNGRYADLINRLEWKLYG